MSLRRADERLGRPVHPRLAEFETSLLARSHECADVVGGDVAKAWQREDAREGHESILGEAVAQAGVVRAVAQELRQILRKADGGRVQLTRAPPPAATAAATPTAPATPPPTDVSRIGHRDVREARQRAHPRSGRGTRKRRRKRVLTPHPRTETLQTLARRSFAVTPRRATRRRAWLPSSRARLA